MAVANRGRLILDDIKERDQDFVKVRDGVNPIWGGLWRGRRTIITPSRSLAALCEVQAFLQNTDNYFTTRRLVLENLWVHERNRQTNVQCKIFPRNMPII